MMCSLPLVSIVIPVYNGEDYLSIAIDSALAQDYRNIEIIVVNDGSTDGTAEIAKSYGNKIRYYEKKNGGVATALNLAVNHAHGEYISWLSHDDIYLPNKVSCQVALAEANNGKIIIYSAYSVYIEKTREEIYPATNPTFALSKSGSLRLLFAGPLYSYGINCCTLLFPKSVFTDVGYFDITLKTTQDYDLLFRAVAKGYCFLGLADSLVVSRQHAMQDSHTKRQLCQEEENSLYTRYLELFLGDIIAFSLADKQEILDGLYARKVKAAIEKLTYHTGLVPQYGRKTYYLFNVLPIFTVSKRRDKTTYYLFKTLRIGRIKNSEGNYNE